MMQCLNESPSLATRDWPGNGFHFQLFKILRMWGFHGGSYKKRQL